MGVLAIAVPLAGCGEDTPSVREGDVESPSEVLGDADEGIPGVQAIRVFYERPVHAEGTIDYEDILADADESDFAYRDLNERAAAAMCYTSGTTGRPKGVL